MRKRRDDVAGRQVVEVRKIDLHGRVVDDRVSVRCPARQLPPHLDADTCNVRTRSLVCRRMDHLSALLLYGVADLPACIRIRIVELISLFRRRAVQRIHMDRPFVQDPGKERVMVKVPVRDDHRKLRDALLGQVLPCHIRKMPAAPVDEETAAASRDDDLRVSPPDISSPRLISGDMYGEGAGCGGSVIGIGDPVSTEPCKHLRQDILREGCPCIAAVRRDMRLCRIPAARSAIDCVVAACCGSRCQYPRHCPCCSFFYKGPCCGFQLCHRWGGPLLYCRL